jgi:hypothetical protein
MGFLTGSWRVRLARTAALAAALGCGSAGGPVAPLQAPPPWKPPAIPPRAASQPVRAEAADPFRVLDAPTGADPCTEVLEIRIQKRARRLLASCASGNQLEFRAALGRLPLGEKSESGDLRTPEGRYRVAEPPRASPYHIFILLDYPGPADADRALDEGRISPLTHAEIRAAHLRGELPPQQTELGGRIGIHGEGPEHQGDSVRRDWTLGCIALSDTDIEFLAFRTAVGTPVSIEP